MDHLFKVFIASRHFYSAFVRFRWIFELNRALIKSAKLPRKRAFSSTLFKLPQSRVAKCKSLRALILNFAPENNLGDFGERKEQKTSQVNLKGTNNVWTALICIIIINHCHDISWYMIYAYLKERNICWQSFVLKC